VTLLESVCDRHNGLAGLVRDSQKEEEN